MPPSSAATEHIDPRRLRDVMGKFATGVTVVTYLAGNEPAGLTANAFTSVSLDPPLVLVSVRNSSRFLKTLSLGGRYGINFLAHDQHALSDHYGGRPQPAVSVSFEMRLGVPLVGDCLASVLARSVDIRLAGDHTLVIGHVEHLQDQAGSPLVYFGGQYQRLSSSWIPCSAAIDVAVKLMSVKEESLSLREDTNRREAQKP